MPNESKINLNPTDLTFPIDESLPLNLTPEQIEESKEELKRKEEKKRLQNLRDHSSFVHLPNDPIYRPISDELLDVNELDKDIPTTTKIMINAALSDYVIFRKVNPNNEDIMENVKVEYKRVNYDEFTRYQEAQEELDYLNNKIAILQQEKQTIETSDKVRQTQKEVKKAIDNKIKVGVEVFFKKNKAEDILLNKALYDYNDLLLNIEIAFFRYSRSPFLRQIL